MRRLLTGCFVTLLLLLNTLVLFGPLMVFALLKLVLPGRLRDYAVAQWQRPSVQQFVQRRRPART
jgi:hypothetical protein